MNRHVIGALIAVLGESSLRLGELILYGNEDMDPVLLETIVNLLHNESITKISEFYEKVIPSYDFQTFKSHFRLTPTCFEITLTQLSNSNVFKRQYYAGKEQLPVEKMLLIAIWVLGTPESYRSVGDRFGVTKSTVFYCLHTVVKAINTDLCKLYIKWPSPDERPLVAQGFNQHKLERVIGVIDGCHIPIKKPVNHAIDYYNRKKFYSMVLQGICKYDLTFIDVDIRWPGGVHDARVFRTSDIYPLGPYLCAPNYFILGDSAYPLLNWLLTPFRNNGHLDDAQTYYNNMLSKTRVKIEHAFGLLKGRFRRLKEYLDINEPKNIVEIILACCVLHNICIVNGDNDVQYINEGQQNLHLINLDFPAEREGVLLRNEICQDLWRRQVRI